MLRDQHVFSVLFSSDLGRKLFQLFLTWGCRDLLSGNFGFAWQRQEFAEEASCRILDENPEADSQTGGDDDRGDELSHEPKRREAEVGHIGEEHDVDDEGV